jgi:hypothetical protein
MNDALRQRNPNSSSGVGDGAVGGGRIIKASSRTRHQQRPHPTSMQHCGNDVCSGITKKAEIRLRIIITSVIITLITIASTLVVRRDKISTSSSQGLRMMSLLRRQQQQQQQQQQQLKKENEIIPMAPRTTYQTIVCTSHPQIKGLLNDDYCDCPDGSDETLTSACSHITVGKRTFACNDEDKTMIFASRVGDGIIDCPDESDEKKRE